MKIEIRRWRAEDAADIALALNNKKVQDNLRDGIPFPYTERDAEQYLDSISSARRDSRYDWAITADGKVIGSVGIIRKDNIHRRTAEIGYYIAEPYWGKGVMTGAVRMACDYILEHTDIIRIFAEPFSTNKASCRVLEKAGFVFEGRMRKNAEKNGEVLDMDLYARVKQDPHE